MRVNKDTKSVDMEQRDFDILLQPYVRSYLFFNKNEMPSKIVIPMFRSLTPYPGLVVEFVGIDSPIAVDIVEDGKVVVQSAGVDEVERAVKTIEENIPKPTVTSPKSLTSPAAKFRTPKTPTVVIPPGSGQLDDMHQRDGKSDAAQIAKDLKLGEDNADEAKEKPYEKKVTKDSQGNIVVE